MPVFSEEVYLGHEFTFELNQTAGGFILKRVVGDEIVAEHPEPDLKSGTKIQFTSGFFRGKNATFINGSRFKHEHHFKFENRSDQPWFPFSGRPGHYPNAHPERCIFKVRHP